MTPVGNKTWLLFTKVLVTEMRTILKKEGVVTISGLHSRLVSSGAGLVRQPFYVSLTGDSSISPIRLGRWEDSREQIINISQKFSQSSLAETVVLYLRLSVFQPLDEKHRETSYVDDEELPIINS
jgi:hypothetical protein